MDSKNYILMVFEGQKTEPIIVNNLKQYFLNEKVDISRDEISEIYLFFDHDGHSHLANREKLENMLQYFNNETENGKLYVSYPMVESLKQQEKYIDPKNCVAILGSFPIFLVDYYGYKIVEEGIEKL